MKTSSLAQVAVCLVALWANTDARAVGTATASITGLSFQLTDLAPNDGVTPEVTFTGYSLSSGSLDPLAGNPIRPNPNPIQTYYQPGAATLSMFSSSDAGMSSNGMESRSTVTADSLTATVSTTGTGLAEAQAYSGSVVNPEQNLWFTISPHTSITFAGTGAVQAYSDGAAIGPYYWQFAGSNAQVSLNIQDSNFAYVAGDSLQVNTISGPGNLGASRIISATYLNTSDTVQNLDFYTLAQAASTSVSAVPVPSGAVLLISGMPWFIAAIRHKARNERDANRLKGNAA